MRILLIIITCLVLISCSKKEDKILPKETNLVESVYSSVTIQPDSLYQVYASVTGILEENFVSEGDIINEDTPILKIINNTPILNTQNAKLALDLAFENYSGTGILHLG